MKRNGYTLVELLVALPIGAAILLVVMASYFQLTQGRVNITQKSIAMNDLDGAIHWFTQDIEMSQDSDLIPGAPPVSAMTLEWSDLTHWGADEGIIGHSVTYYLSENQLFRNYDGQLQVAARHITNIGFTLDNRIYTVNMTSQPGLPESAVTRIISCEMRTDETP